MTACSQAIAYVMLAPDLRGLLLFPRDCSDRQLKHSLMEACPQLGLKRTADGFFVESSQAASLLLYSTLGWSSEARRFAENRAWIAKIGPPLRDCVAAVKEGGAQKARRDLSSLDG